MKIYFCPICRKKLPDDWVESDLFPFCSKRCRLVDLGHWFSDDYAIPAKEPPGAYPDDSGSLSP